MVLQTPLPGVRCRCTNIIPYRHNPVVKTPPLFSSASDILRHTCRGLFPSTVRKGRHAVRGFRKGRRTGHPRRHSKMLRPIDSPGPPVATHRFPGVGTTPSSGAPPATRSRLLQRPRKRTHRPPATREQTPARRTERRYAAAPPRSVPVQSERAVIQYRGCA